MSPLPNYYIPNSMHNFNVGYPTKSNDGVIVPLQINVLKQKIG